MKVVKPYWVQAGKYTLLVDAYNKKDAKRIAKTLVKKKPKQKVYEESNK